MTLTSEERELEARKEAGKTLYSPGVKPLLCICFVVLILGGALWQLVQDLRDEPGTWPKTLDPARLAPVWEEIHGVATDEGWLSALKSANQRTLVNIKDYETDLEDSSPLIEALVPSTNLLVTGVLRGSTESVYPGLEDWLFYRPDVAYVTSRGFLDPAFMDTRRKAVPGVEPDPLPAIIELRDALSVRDIELIVVPAPVKPTIYPDEYTGRYSGGENPIQNPSYATYLDRLEEEGIRYVDLAKALSKARENYSQPLYLKSDTHWSPAGMRVAAEAIARTVAQLGLTWGKPMETFAHSKTEVSNQGDISAMLPLPGSSAKGKRESVTIEPVTASDGRKWSPDAAAEILLLGDSFANVYSLSSLGWGSSAGLVEHLSALLGRRVDTICINSNGSYATRLTLSGQIRRGRDRLAGKKVVIYEFTCRELAFGDWKTGLRY